SAEPSSFVFPSMLWNLSASAETTIPVCAYLKPAPGPASLRKKLPGVIRARCDGDGPVSSLSPALRAISSHASVRGIGIGIASVSQACFRQNVANPAHHGHVLP